MIVILYLDTAISRDIVIQCVDIKMLKEPYGFMGYIICVARCTVCHKYTIMGLT